MDNTKRLQLTVTALKQSLANKVADYEEQLANIRAEASILLEEQGERIQELEQKLNAFEEAKDSNVAVPSEDA
ncbi:hypothetical protein SEA_FAUST_45 [Streptomyces phage Faust]|uniref:Uncharacterized protein n=1 Tax=Streptomyces phage Faust TaxID=2767565 RepID=A0A7G9UYP3_9CAUD|nr:hypothetical protein PP456_gp211 [Streptomyces phage Faust]QNN99148.1 hypothetical protein SEA_FAUST_45 [Streptomyces phage Faust]